MVAAYQWPNLCKLCIGIMEMEFLRKDLKEVNERALHMVTKIPFQTWGTGEEKAQKCLFQNVMNRQWS